MNVFCVLEINIVVQFMKRITLFSIPSPFQILLKSFVNTNFLLINNILKYTKLFFVFINNITELF